MWEHRQKKPSDLLPKVQILTFSFFCMKDWHFGFVRVDSILGWLQIKIKFSCPIFSTMKHVIYAILYPLPYLNQDIQKWFFSLTGGMTCVLKEKRMAKGRISTSILHVPLWLERHQSLFTHVRWRLWDLEIFRSLHFEQKKKNQSWNKKSGVTEIRTANPSSEIVEPPTRLRETWRFRSVEERRRKKKTNNWSTFRAPRTHFSP